MKFHKEKCQILHLGWGSSGCLDRLRNERLEISAVEMDLGVLSVKQIYGTNICEERSQNITGIFQYLRDGTNNEDVITEVYYRLPNQENDDIKLLLEKLRDTSKSNALVLVFFNLPAMISEHLETKAWRFLKHQDDNFIE
ncbi:hypothetical protein HGM15179_001419 [Zosterops borbonicus]|uniref:Uncharacterized protein n=1 Tax=Zosterops borbonicus TaxID=364589 RepID=A0A8K1LSY7_9PASS|nr:hypothetical protein HGM15179_001419 [Zosterops borbonicus]